MVKKFTTCLAALSLVGTTVLGTAAFASCGKKSSSDLRILLLANNAEDAFYKKYFAELEEQYGIKITYNGYEEINYYQKLKADVQRGDKPDIFYLRPNELMTYGRHLSSLEDYSKKQTAVNLSDIYESALNMYRYNPSTKKLDENGELYAFPKDLSTQQLGYNKTIVEQYKTQIEAAGLTVPWEMDFSTKTYTWDEYRKMCEVIATEANNEGKEIYGSDVPDIEILVKSFGGELLNGDTVTVDSDAVKKAVEVQAKLCTPNEGKQPAAHYASATYANFTIGKVAFYGAVGSWEISSYDAVIGKGNWGVMPWPTVDGSANWQGRITSAGFVVSNTCGNKDVAMEIAASFLTNRVQDRLVREESLSLPLSKSLASSYVSKDNDSMYSPSTRSVFIDVISGTHGFFPVKYTTKSDSWLDIFSTELQAMWNASITDNTTSLAKFGEMDFGSIQSKMQKDYNEFKD